MTETPTTESGPQLDYAQTPRLSSRKAFRRGLLAMGLLAIVICGWVMLPRYWRNARDAMHHRQWMRYTRPPTAIAFEPPGEKAKTLFTPGSGYVMRPGGVFHQLNIPGFPSDALFLHARRRPDGQQRVVWVTIGYASTANGIRLQLESDVLIPGTTLNPGRRVSATSGPLLADSNGNAPRIYAGQPDPADESHFTMQFEFPDGRSGTIYGRLTHRDTVDLQIEPPL